MVRNLIDPTPANIAAALERLWVAVCARDDGAKGEAEGEEVGVHGSIPRRPVGGVTGGGVAALRKGGQSARSHAAPSGAAGRGIQ